MLIVMVGGFPIGSGHLPYLQHSSPVQSKMSNWLSMCRRMASHASYIPSVLQMGKHPGSISSSGSITSTVNPLKMEWISRVSFLQMLNLELLAASITIVAVGVSSGHTLEMQFFIDISTYAIFFVSKIFPTVVSISTAKSLRIGALCVGSEHRCGPPALCPDSKKPSASTSVARSVYSEVVDDAL